MGWPYKGLTILMESDGIRRSLLVDKYDIRLMKHWEHAQKTISMHSRRFHQSLPSQLEIS